MTAVAEATTAPRMTRVQVWFGDHCIVDWKGNPEYAQRFADAQQRRFMSCRVTTTPVPAPKD